MHATLKLLEAFLEKVLEPYFGLRVQDLLPLVPRYNKVLEPILGFRALGLLPLQ